MNASELYCKDDINQTVKLTYWVYRGKHCVGTFIGRERVESYGYRSAAEARDSWRTFRQMLAAQGYRRVS